MKGPSIVIVDSNWQVRERLRRIYESRGYVAWTCPGPDMALPIFENVMPDVVLIDLDEESAEAELLSTACHDVSPDSQIIFRKKHGNAVA